MIYYLLLDFGTLLVQQLNQLNESSSGSDGVQSDQVHPFGKGRKQANQFAALNVISSTVKKSVLGSWLCDRGELEVSLKESFLRRDSEGLSLTFGHSMVLEQRRLIQHDTITKSQTHQLFQSPHSSALLLNRPPSPT